MLLLRRFDKRPYILMVKYLMTPLATLQAA